MNKVWILARKEFLSYFASPLGYIVAILFLSLMMYFFFFFENWFEPLAQDLDMRRFFFWLKLVATLIVPMIAMPVWAEERKLGTDELMLTFPVTTGQAVIGKFLGSYAFLGLIVLLTLTVPFTLNSLGDLDTGPIYGGYLASLLMVGAYLAIGTFCSSLTDNQIIAFIVGFVVLLFLFFMGYTPLVDGLGLGEWVFVVKYISTSAHFDDIEKGVASARDIAYYFSVIAAFLFFTTIALQRRN